MFLVFFHELGHFTAAKKMGVYVERFSIGFSMFGLFKPLIIKKIKETEYHIYPTLFFGGYVKMKGQDDSNPSLKSYDEDSYNSKKPWQRIIILLAGPFANILLAWILFIIIGFGGATTYEAIVGSTQENSPAYEAGLIKGDKIVAINGQQIKQWSEIGELITKTDGILLFTIKRENQILNLEIEPKLLETETIFKEPIKRKMIGITPIGSTIVIDMNFYEIIDFATANTISAVTLITKSLEKLVSGVIPSSEVGSVVSIGKVISQASDVGIIAVLSITALISVNLGVLNLLPIPALDGGHLMFNLYEMITKRPPSDAVFTQMTMAGWILLLGLMGLGLFNDFNRLLNG